MTRRDHNTNPLSIELFRTKPSKQAHGENHGVEKFTILAWYALSETTNGGTDAWNAVLV